ncbi:MAG: DUF2812 domain-containing protein [Lachnospiraceae bacterium]|nr:DUF2812 domain-containing protein [Lachnospiraceae bacterium]
MKKYKVFVDIGKEEKYLNKMSENGYEFKKYSQFGFYTFEKGLPKSRNYKIDYRQFKNKAELSNYIALFEDSGWKHVYGKRYNGSQYFLPKSKDAKDIFSDNESRATLYKRLYEQCAMAVIMGLLYFIIVLISVNFNISNLLFLTPGLWEKTGVEFRRAFWFEAPFVILRIIPIIYLFGFTVIYAIWGTKAKKIYKEKLQIIEMKE